MKTGNLFLKTGANRQACWWIFLAIILIAGCSDTVDKVMVTGQSASATVFIDAKACIACAPRYCWESCPVRAISAVSISAAQTVYVIDPAQCIRCGECIKKCPFGAIAWKR
jgi:Fe-S-cluster-containing hydrogenase component 2